MAISGAAPIPPDLLRWYGRLGLKIAEGYGLTENCALSHITGLGEDVVRTTASNAESTRPAVRSWSRAPLR